MANSITEAVLSSIGPETDPRLKEIITGLVRHIHAFVQEANLTTDEFMAGIRFLNWAGQMSTDRRNEGLLVSDVLGIESLVDQITYKQAASRTDATTSAILGPFWRADTPTRAFGSTIVLNVPEDGEVAYLYGTVTDASSGKPIQNASVDIWEASTNGLYEQQDPEQTEHNLRGKFYTNEKGQYALYCLRPTPYPVPSDGPAGKLLQLLHRHPYRPAHIHFMVQANGYLPVTTQVFDRNTKYLDSDSVFATNGELVIDFVPRKNDPNASLEVEYNLQLAAAK